MKTITLYFPDISGWQADIDLYRAIIVFIKATEGTYMTSSWYAKQKAEAQHHGAFVLGYHFLIAGNVAAQAQRLHSVIGSTPASLDVEAGPGNSKPSLGDAIGFIDAYRKLGGVIHWVYLPHWYWQGTLGSPSLKPLVDRRMNLKSSAYPSSGYTDANTGVGWQPYGGMQPQAWQYTDRCQFNGQAIDFSAFRGNYAGKQDPASVAACLAEFKTLTVGTQPTPAKRWQEWVSTGGRTLNEFASEVANCEVSTLLRQTAVHYGWFNDPLARYLNDAADGKISPHTTKLYKGAKFWIYY